jgi:hypothetical protein
VPSWAAGSGIVDAAFFGLCSADKPAAEVATVSTAHTDSHLRAAIDEISPEHEALVLCHGRHLIDLVHQSLPGPQRTDHSPETVWQVTLGPAFLAKAAGTLESMLILLPRRHEVDALTLLRSLFEAVVSFSWVALEPSTNVYRWYSECHYWRLQEHREWLAAGSPPLLTEEEVTESEAFLKEHPRGRKTIAQRAKEADTRWAALVPGWGADSQIGADTGWLSTLVGLHRWIYARGSDAAHSRNRGLDPFVTYSHERVLVHNEDRATSLLVYEAGTYLLCMMLGVADQSLGWTTYRPALAVLGREAAVFPPQECSD